MIKQKYRRAFVKDASQRLTQHTVARINEIFGQIRGTIGSYDER
jgi:hypothetical protein